MLTTSGSSTQEKTLSVNAGVCSVWAFDAFGRRRHKPHFLPIRPLGAGERAAITPALSMHADLILIDERKGTAVALEKGFAVT